ncbi:MAG: class I SAM-dependent methyltransferase [Acidobacteriota bacterium]
MSADATPTQRFSSRVEDYIKYRPGYPAIVLDVLAKEAGLTSASVVADVGSGTGIFSEMLLKRGNPVLAVEPNDEMRAAAERRLKGYPSFSSLAGRAEDTGLAASSVDFVVTAQAFHWFKQDDCRREFARILRDEGWVVLIWNTLKTDATPFLRAYEGLLQRCSLDYRQVHHKNVSLEAIGRFFGGLFYSRSFENRQILDFEGLKGRVKSCSFVPLEGHSAYEPMMQSLQEIFAQFQVGGKVCLEYETELQFGHLIRESSRQDGGPSA